MEATVFAARREKLIETLPDNSLTFLFAGDPKQKSNDNDYPFRINNNFYYMTGMDDPGQVMMIAKLSGKASQWLFIERPDPIFELFNGKQPTVEEVKEQTGFTYVDYLDRLDYQVGRQLSYYPYDYVLFDLHKAKLDYVGYPENALCKKLTDAYPNLTVRNIAHTIDNLRRFKTADEIECIKKAVELTEKGIHAILDHLKPGVNEAELQAWWDFTLTMNGAKDNAFLPIIAGGKNSCVLHYEENDQVVQDGEVLQIDLGAEYGYYSADISRCFPANGKFTEEQKFYYNAVLYGQQKVLEALKPGLPLRDTTRIAREAIGEKLLEAGKISDIKEMANLLPHGVSHYMGLDVHDVGDIGELQPGMVITVEPGVYIPELKLGIRIEDDALITEDGCIVLSPQILRTAEEVEEYMASRK